MNSFDSFVDFEIQTDILLHFPDTAYDFIFALNGGVSPKQKSQISYSATKDLPQPAILYAEPLRSFSAALQLFLCSFHIALLNIAHLFRSMNRHHSIQDRPKELHAKQVPTALVGRPANAGCPTKAVAPPYIARLPDSFSAMDDAFSEITPTHKTSLSNRRRSDFARVRPGKPKISANPPSPYNNFERAPFRVALPPP